MNVVLIDIDEAEVACMIFEALAESERPEGTTARELLAHVAPKDRAILKAGAQKICAYFVDMITKASAASGGEAAVTYSPDATKLN